jgi:Icc-related predicted phosphoesterase
MLIQICSDIESNFDGFPLLSDSVELILAAGDLTRNGTYNEYYSMINWMRDLVRGTDRMLMYVGGNHDWKIPDVNHTNIRHLDREPTIWNGISFLGFNLVYDSDPQPHSSPQVLTTCLNVDEAYYSKDLPQVDIVLSHSPAYGAFDNNGLSHEGSPALSRYLEAKPPALFVCGHTDDSCEAYVGISPFPKTRYINTHKKNRLIEFNP